MSTAQPEAKPRFLDRLSAILQKSRLALLILLIALLAGIIAYFVWTEIQNAAREKSAALGGEGPGPGAAVGGRDGRGEEAVAGEGAHGPAGPHPVEVPPPVRGAEGLPACRPTWPTAPRTGARPPKTTRPWPAVSRVPTWRPWGCCTRGSAHEELGDAKQALSSYQRVRERYRDSYLLPRVLFSIGRLLETEGDSAGALKVLQRAGR